MDGSTRANSGRILLCCLAGIVYLAICAYFPDFMPRCLLRLVSGYDCPACGAQRAVRCFAAGDFAAGFWCNPYLCILLPYILLLTLAEVRKDRMAGLHRRLTDPVTVISLAVFMIVWWVLRNTALWHEVIDKYATRMPMT